MEAYKCDRCGSFYTENARKVSDMTGDFIGGCATLTAGGSRDKRFDLCDDCVSDLLIFLKCEEESDHEPINNNGA